MPTTAPLTPTDCPHIFRDDRGRYWVDNAIRVTMLVSIHGPDGPRNSAEWIQEGYPHLSLTQIYAGLFFYYDHKAELDVVMAAERAEVEAIAAKLENPATRARLRQEKEEWIKSGRYGRD